MVRGRRKGTVCRCRGERCAVVGCVGVGVWILIEALGAQIGAVRLSGAVHIVILRFMVRGMDGGYLLIVDRSVHSRGSAQALTLSR